ncbi:MAG: tRNA dimethylallyltransferase [Candidatus Uhrbacteria bacterium GW2011_GWE2_45_35]|uniref:tRNA dimethylallyltransferase n=1 Tax=Candidatus Uhrbacteria bacterium GW2011_GWE2_45_35 TaxID=1618993 RepID=A0A0G1MFD1_9BACT|nr:MAG: tRNA dimethylallyltransferase [Candidatus Uhrbacteria bacterium GW2011_GWE2_45_35]HBR80979.1 tRNA (adenosine(37)-N6)-dimethylallyltransferase MiaA [Candidatus Uhrbacteria bacterium]HCU31928.1 tRNA (adenosine(37)-N6)-dimethylallyltransferase MiaA [Candidatus Uhrbacteria bacterium]
MFQKSLPKLLVIVGPTGAGKSAIAYKLAAKFNGEILCVDSRTVYRGMDVGTGKDVVSPPPFGIDLVNPDQEMNGALFKQYAEKTITEILDRGHLPILVGGTGLWVDMIIEGRDLPEVGPDLELRAKLEEKSEDELFAEYQKIDPVGAEIIDRKNKRRLIRALEVCKKTGRPFSEFLKGGAEKYNVLWLGVDWSMEVLEERINARVDEMIANGWLDEVKKLKKKFGCESYAMSGIGYQEICRFLDNAAAVGTQNFVSLPLSVVNEIKIRTRQYAKRQKTWFKRNEKIHWLNDVDSAVVLVDEWVCV